MTLTRRALLQTPALAMAAPSELPTKLKTRASKDIAASPLSVGFETLDRKMFEPEKTYEHLAQLGVKWARCQTGWARTETKKGEYDFAWLDSVVDNLLRIGIQPWFNLGYGNTLYTPGSKHESAVGWVPFNSPEARQAWTRYVARIAERYAKRVRHWELWNEPNITNFWQPDKPDAARYVELVKLTAPIIRKRVPKCTLIGGALAGFPVLDYLENCMKAGLGDHVDKISYHPYRAQPELRYADEMRAFRGVIDRYKRGLGVWQGENGAPSTTGSTGALRELPWNETRQAKWVVRRILMDLKLRVDLTSYFHTVDMVNYVWTSGQSDLTNSKGLLRGKEYTPKPSYFAYRNICTLFDADTRPADFLLRLDRPKGAADGPSEWASFVRRGAAMYAYWAPLDLMQDTPETKVRLNVWSGGGASFEAPVLIDPLSGEVKLPGKVTRSGNSTTLDGLPLRDYPMLVADRAVLDCAC